MTDTNKTKCNNGQGCDNCKCEKEDLAKKYQTYCEANPGDLNCKIYED